MIPRWRWDELPAALGWLGAAPGAEGDLEAVAARADLDLQPVSARAADLEGLLRHGGPAIARIGGSDEAVVLLSAGRRRAIVLAPDLRRVRVPLDALLDALSPGERAEPLLAHVPARYRLRARRALAARLDGEVGPWWLVRPAAHAPLAAHLREHGLARLVPAWLALHLLAYGMWVASFVWLGRAALAGALEPAWVAGWALLFASIAPVRAATVWLQGRIATRAGLVLQQRLLVGALALPIDEVRRGGTGPMFGRVHDAGVLERLALDGGLGALLAAAEWLVAAGLLWAGGQYAIVGVSVGFLAATAAATLALYARRRRWIGDREALTAILVEDVLGDGTRAVQAPPAAWHLAEDAALEQYLRASRGADALAVAVRAIPALWLAAGVATVGPPFVAGTLTTGALAGALGGVLLVGRALDGLARGASDLVTAAIAFERVADLLALARTRPSLPSPETAGVPAPGPSDPVLELRGVGFRYPPADGPTLAGLQLTIGPRDRVLVQGASGSGKSTLSALILGLRAPTAGSVLLGGLDRSIWGARGWRDQITGAPQFHENHLLGGTLAFNLLLGRRWPPSPEDLRDAIAVCRQLGLGPLLQAMPAGIHQIVGETGWQLSHGERSRVYLARALLQDARLVVLDESLGALDAQATEWCLYRANAFPGALVVIAHP